MAGDMPKLLNSLHVILLATVVGALPTALTKRDEELDRYQREHLHNQIPEYTWQAVRRARQVVNENGRGATDNHPRYNGIAYPREIEPLRRGVWEYPLTASVGGSMQTPGHDRVLLDDNMNYIGVITRDAAVVNRDNYQSWHWAVPTNRHGHQNAYMDYPGVDWMQACFFPAYGFLLAWNWLASSVSTQGI
ncbi:hypothetical protein DL770_002307 [Monosporascus sp. CRB-9-2]|nr:hypothetical protein DL770_002307 [Monosporascus sp. CRB-9-2]